MREFLKSLFTQNHIERPKWAAEAEYYLSTIGNCFTLMKYL